MRDAAIDTNRPPRRTGASRPASDRPKGDLSSAAIAAQRLGGALDRPPGRSRAPSRRAVPARRWGLPAFVRRVSPVKALTSIVFSAALVGIVANAVLFQRGRHAGPALDGPHDPLAAASAPAKVAAAPDAAPASAVPASPDMPPAPVATPPAADAVPAAPRRPAAAKHAAAKPDGDAIGQLIGAAASVGDKAALKGTDGKPVEAKADPILLRTQRQLKKLGYAVRPDGRMDGGTRQAIKRFAQDHHLKSEAALTPELRHQIADASATPAKPAAESAPKVQ